MKILVTGGAGFIGSHVTELFLSRGFDVLVVDNLSTGHKQNVPARARFLQLDIRSEECSRTVMDFKPDVIAHLAAQMDVRKSVEDPVFDGDVNVLGIVRLLQAAQSSGCSRILFSSTGGAIYGEQEVFPAPETHPCRPVSPYGVSKFCSEQYLAYFERSGGPAYTALRYANVYGPRQDPHGEAGVVAIFAGRLLSGKAPIVYGDGSQTRDYVFVKDVARANLLALERQAGGVYNIGTGQETDVNTLAAMMSRIGGFSGKPEYRPVRAGEQMRSAVDPALAARDLGWKPSVSLEQGLVETVAHFRENPHP